MDIKLYKSILFLLLCSMAGCTYDYQETKSLGENFDVPVDFSPIYVIGDQHASGFMNGALYREAQEFSYPHILTKKLMITLGEENVFQQATIESTAGFNLEVFNRNGQIQGKYYLSYPESGSIYPRRSSSQGEALSAWSGELDDLTDFTLPSLKIYQIDSLQALQQNGYYNRIGTGKTPVEHIIDSDPGVVVVDIGSDDLLRYALTGAVGNESPIIDSIGANDLISAGDFDKYLNNLIDQILSNTNAHIFIANLSDPLLSPYFRTLSRNLRTDMYSVHYLAALMQHYREFNLDVFQYNEIEEGGVPSDQKRPLVDFDTEGYPNISPPFHSRAIKDEYLNEAQLNDGTVIPKWRQTAENELVLYKNEPNLNESSPLSGKVPLADEDVLTIPEIGIIHSRLAAFNQSIEMIANSYSRVSLIDVHRVIEEISEEEYSIDGVIYSNQFDRYGIYSADGYSLNSRGNAVIANEFIKSINNTFGTNLNYVNPNDYRGTEFIFSQ